MVKIGTSRLTLLPYVPHDFRHNNTTQIKNRESETRVRSNDVIGRVPISFYQDRRRVNAKIPMGNGKTISLTIGLCRNGNHKGLFIGRRAKRVGTTFRGDLTRGVTGSIFTSFSSRYYFTTRANVRNGSVNKYATKVPNGRFSTLYVNSIQNGISRTFSRDCGVGRNVASAYFFDIRFKRGLIVQALASSMRRRSGHYCRPRRAKGRQRYVIRHVLRNDVLRLVKNGARYARRADRHENTGHRTRLIPR